MTVLINTDDVPAGQRWDAWCGTICDTLGPLDVRMVDADAPLWGEIRTGQLGPVSIARVATSTPHTVHRTPRLVRRAAPELYRVAVSLGGRHVIAQDERVAVLNPGDFCIYDYTRPYDLSYRAAFRLALFVFPQALLPVRPAQVREITAIAFRGRDGAAGLVSGLLGQLANGRDAWRPDTSARVSTVLLDLVAAALAERFGQAGAVAAESSRRLLLHRVFAFIEEHLAEEDLTPTAIAVAHHLSLRSLYQLFAGQETTVAGWIRDRRLERCRKDLADPGQREVTVSTIAARWGLHSPEQLSRLFRRTYGITPTDYRRAYDGNCD